MGLGMVSSKGGDNRRYIFKDGVFKITPTVSLGSIVNGNYQYSNPRGTADNIDFLKIPYVKSGETIYVKFSPQEGGLESIAMNFSTGNYYIGQTSATQSVTQKGSKFIDIVGGLPSDTTIDFHLWYPWGGGTMIIKEIGVVGGVARNYFFNIIKHLHKGGTLLWQ